MAPTLSTIPPSSAAISPVEPQAAESSEPVPPAIAFGVLAAVDDRVAAEQDVLRIDILGNDNFGSSPRIVSVVQPLVGSVSIENDQLVVSVPPSFAGELDFDYVLTDESGVESTASVTVFSLNVLSSASGVDEVDRGSSPGQVLGRVGSLFVGLAEIRLDTVQLSVLALGPVVFGLLRWLLRRHEDLLSITRTSRTRSVALGSEGGDFRLRHDALVWGRGKTRKLKGGKSETLVELPNGERTWVDSALIIDTGY